MAQEQTRRQNRPVETANDNTPLGSSVQLVAGARNPLNLLSVAKDITAPKVLSEGALLSLKEEARSTEDTEHNSIGRYPMSVS